MLWRNKSLSKLKFVSLEICLRHSGTIRIPTKKQPSNLKTIGPLKLKFHIDAVRPGIGSINQEMQECEYRFM